MDWIKFVSDHPGRLAFQRIGRSIYNEATNHEVESSTLSNWLRSTEHKISSFQ